MQMDNEPKTELPPESFGERGGRGTKDEPTVDQPTADPQPGIGSRPVEEKLPRPNEDPTLGERRNEGVGTTE
jgi:hypothetical protein